MLVQIIIKANNNEIARNASGLESNLFKFNDIKNLSKARGLKPTS